MNRPAAIALAALALLVATGGCLSLVSGETTTFEASAPSVPDATLEETGYALTENDTAVVSENVTVLGRERTVRVVTHVRRYEKSVSVPLLEDLELARVAVATTPRAEVAGRAVNPVGELSERRLVDRFSGDRGPSNLTRVGNRSVRSLGADRTVQTFAGTVERGGREVAVTVHAAKFKHEEDYMILVGVHPRSLDDERGNVDAFLRGLNH